MNPSFDTSKELSEKVMEFPRVPMTQEMEETPVETEPSPPRMYEPPTDTVRSRPSPRPRRPSPRPRPSSSQVPSESVDVYLAPIPSEVSAHLEAQPKEGTKYNHFQFKDKARMERALSQRIQSAVSEPVKVEFHYNVKKRPDVHITRSSGATVGKIHFLHFNRPDMCDPSKWFVKLFFYEFTDAQEYHAIRNAMVGFFKKLAVSRSSPAEWAPSSRYQGGKKTKTQRKRSSRRAQKPRRRHTRFAK